MVPCSRSQNRFRSILLLLIMAALLYSGCATTYTPEKNQALFAQKAPALRYVPRGQQLATAEAHAARQDRAFALIGSVRSMEPMYPSGTAVVVQERDYKSLEKGMPVVYRNSRGFYVAHMLVWDLPSGWLAFVINNTEPDDDLVTAENLVGVITEAYAPATAQPTLASSSNVTATRHPGP
jgi:hypothetical protein